MCSFLYSIEFIPIFYLSLTLYYPLHLASPFLSKSMSPLLYISVFLSNIFPMIYTWYWVRIITDLEDWRIATLLLVFELIYNLNYM